LTTKARDTRKITAARYTWTDYKTSIETEKELNITPVLDKIQEYRRNWLQHINRSPRILRELQINRQKQPGEIIKETSRCVRPEWVNK
jgi:uncharacterized membrane-anchored protein YhcB (DUF1043 family)